MSIPDPQPGHAFPTKPFLLLRLVLAVLAGASLWLTAWCWPRFGERACGIYVLPVDFLMSLTIFTLVTLVFDKPWGKLLLFSIAISAAAVLGIVVARLINNAWFEPLQGYIEVLRFLGTSIIRIVYMALIQTIIPAAILRGLVRQDALRITIKRAALFGVILGLGYAIFITGLFGMASIIQPGSVAPGYIFTWGNIYSALILGLAAFAGVLLGRALRNNV